MTARVIGPFEIHEQLGKGGIGEVYAGVDQLLGRPVAIKALRPEFSRDRSFVERFRGEATNLARLNHPNITTLYSLHKEGDELYMVMELVRGSTLESILSRAGRLGLNECIAIMAQAVAGLTYAHRMGVIHRDIKPANLMVTESGLLKIMDFGIARIQGSQRMTRQGDLIGTLAYMSPEQLRGAEGDARSDLYSLAMVFYELVSGNTAFHATSEYDLIRAQVEQRPPPLVGQVPDLDPKAEAVMMQALAKTPDERFPTVDAFGRALGTTAIQGDAADIVKETVVARWGAAPPAATRMISISTGAAFASGAAAPAAPSGTAPAEQPAASGGGVLRTLLTRLGVPPPMQKPVMALGGVAAALVIGLAYIVIGSSTPAPPKNVALASRELPSQSQPEKSAAPPAPVTPSPQVAIVSPPQPSSPPAVSSPPATPAPPAATPTAPPAVVLLPDSPSATPAPPIATPTPAPTPAPPAATPTTPPAVILLPNSPSAKGGEVVITTPKQDEPVPAPAATPPSSPPPSAAAPSVPSVAQPVATPTAPASTPAATPPAKAPQVASLPSSSKAPSTRSSGSAAEAPALEGPVTAVLDSGAIVVAGRVVNLYGILGETGRPAAEFQNYIAHMGNRVSCFARPSNSFECRAQGYDVAEAAVLNGAARARARAPSKYRTAEQEARAAHRGIWGM